MASNQDSFIQKLEAFCSRARNEKPMSKIPLNQVTEALGPSSGYDCNFVSEPDDALKCLICLAVARDPRQHGECGRLFCEKCLNEHGKWEPCPNCRVEQPQYLKDTRSKCGKVIVSTSI